MTRPPEKLDAQMTANVRLHFFQFLRSLLRFGSGWSANHSCIAYEDCQEGRGFSARYFAVRLVPRNER